MRKVLTIKMDDLNEDELKLLESLEDPNKPKQRKYMFDVEYQQSILGMLILDRVFLVQSLQLVKSSYFIEKSHECICQVVFDHFNKHVLMPSKREISEGIRSKFPNDANKVLLYTSELNAIIKTYAVMESRDFCLDKITEFAKEQSLRSAISVTLDLLERNPKNKFEKISEEFNKAMLVDRNLDLGLNYFENVDKRYDLMEQQMQSKELFITGFKSIDEGLGGGISAGETSCFLGLSNSGKSLLLAHCSIRNMLRGKKVLYLSLEMNELKTAKRFDSMLSGVNIRHLMQNKLEVIKELNSRVEGDLDKKKLIIKQFPAASMDMNLLRSYYSQLVLNGFIPSLVIIDYLGEFANIPNVKLHESREILSKAIRSFSIENNVCVMTALQSNRTGKTVLKENGVLDEENIGDSYGSIRPFDLCISINQSQEEKQLNILRLFTFKVRDGASKYFVYLKQDPETLSYHEISQETYTGIRSSYSKKKVEDVDEIIKPWRPGQ